MNRCHYNRVSLYLNKILLAHFDVHVNGRGPSRYSDSLRDERSRDRIPMGGVRLTVLVHTGPWGPPIHLYNGYRVFFPEFKETGAWL